MARLLALIGTLWGALWLSAAPAGAQPYLRIHDGDLTNPVVADVRSRPARSRSTVSPLTAFAWNGMVLEDGGTLNPISFVNPSALSRSATIAFFALVDGVDRNQGIFLADAAGVRTLVRGCGGGGGSNDPGTACGDPAPSGGTFSGFYGGTFFAPAINDAGDVLFFADVFSRRKTTRGLFLYQAATGKIVKVARTGDRLPYRGQLAAIGPGSLNNNGDVAFLAQLRHSPPTSVDVLRWDAGMLSTVAAVGGHAPGGGMFSMLGTETLSFSSGVTIPVGPVPGINGRGQVSFRAIVTGGVTDQGLIVSTNGIHRWYAKAGDATPDGGTYLDFWAPVLNNDGDIAFVADYVPTPGGTSSAWFVGSPRHGWRRALGLFDPIDGGQCLGIAVSRNPMRPLDENGDVLVWSDIQMPEGGTQEKLLLSAADGTTSTIVTQGDLAPVGGVIGNIQGWPSLRLGRGTVSASTPGAGEGITSAHMLTGDLP